MQMQLSILLNVADISQIKLVHLQLKQSCCPCKIVSKHLEPTDQSLNFVLTKTEKMAPKALTQTCFIREGVKINLHSVTCAGK